MTTGETAKVGVGPVSPAESFIREKTELPAIDRTRISEQTRGRSQNTTGGHWPGSVCWFHSGFWILDLTRPYRTQSIKIHHI